MDYGMALESFLKLCGILGIVAGSVKAIVYFTTPYRSITRKLKRHSEFFANDKRALEDLEKKVYYEKECINAIGMAISELINHEITGNDVEELKARQRELNSVLLQSQQNYKREV